MGTAIFEKDHIRILDSNGELKRTIGPDEDLMLDHWEEECIRFREEFDQWEEFREHQRQNENHPPLIIVFDPEKTDQKVVGILNKLNDWREFHRYQLVKVGRATMSTWNITRVIEKITDEEIVSDKTASGSRTQHEFTARPLHRLRELFRRQKDLENSKVPLTWIESQTPEILLEACSSLDNSFPLQQQLETKLEQQAHGFYQHLKELEARPDQSVQSPNQCAGFAERVCHWGSEVSRLIDELWEWRIFLKWRRLPPNGLATEYTKEQQGSNKSSSELNVWVDYVAFRRYELDRTRRWVAGWQCLLKLEEDELYTTQEPMRIFFIQENIARARAYVEEFQRDNDTAETNVQLAEQLLAKLSSQQISSSKVFSPSGSSELHGNTPKEHEVMNSSSSPTKDSQTIGSAESSISGVSATIQLSNCPIEEKGVKGANKCNTNKEKSATTADYIGLGQDIIFAYPPRADIKKDSISYDTWPSYLWQGRQEQR